MREKREKKKKTFTAAQPNLLCEHVSHCRKDDDATLLTPYESGILVAIWALKHHLNSVKAIIY
jgi:hypothetical protein